MRRQHLQLLFSLLLGSVLLCTPSRSFASVSAAAFGGAGLDGEPGEDLMGFGIGARAGMTSLVPKWRERTEDATSER